MSKRHFKCTACGQCCVGWLPLTLDDALTFAHLFPLAIMWEVVRHTSKSFDLAARLGTTVQLPAHKRVAVIITPLAYIPPDMACPALAPDRLCSIHAEKPRRCRAMPFYAYREESEQLEFLLPRKGWDCDVSDAAPTVYRDKKILTRADFEAEREALEAQAPQLRTYANLMLKQSAPLMSQVIKAATMPTGGRFVVNFSPLLRLQREGDLAAFAQKQHPVLIKFAQQTGSNAAHAAYHTYYQQSATELGRFIRQTP